MLPCETDEVGHGSAFCPSEEAESTRASGLLPLSSLPSSVCPIRKTRHVGQVAYSGHADSAIVIWRLFQARAPTRPLGQQGFGLVGLPNWPVGYGASPLLSIRRPNDQQADQLTNRRTERRQ